LDSVGPKIKKLSYVTNTSTMVALFSMYRTYADETKTGHVDAAMVGDFTNTLGTNKNSDMGGTAEAEATPLYNYLIGGNRPSSTGVGFLQRMLSPTTYAATASTSAYLCNNGKPVPAGELVCSETKPGGGNGLANSIHDITNSAAIAPVTQLAKLWNKTAGGLISSVLSPLGDVISNIPGIGNITDFISSAFEPIVSSVIQYLVPAIASDNMSGGRVFDLAAGGADVAGNDYAHNGLGGQKLSDQQVAAIYNEQQQSENARYSNQSFIARMFDTSSDQSAITKLALAVPNSPSTAISTFMSNPLGNIFSGFSSIFSSRSTYAAAAPQGDPFGITQYGYPTDSAVFATDPEKYWDDNCTTDGTTLDMTMPVNVNWHKDIQINKDTYMPENTTTNPCLLIQAAVGSAGALYDSTLLTPDDLVGNSDSTSPAPAVAATTSGNLSTLNGHTLDANQSKQIKYIADSVLPLLKGTPDEKASLAARVTWWSLKEGVLGLTEQPYDPFGYSNCGSGSGNTHIDIVAPCSASTWQVGIAAVQVTNFTDTVVENMAQSLHPGMSTKEILASVAKLSGLSEGSAKYKAIVNSTGIMRRSFLLRDPATGFTLADTNVKAECVDAWMPWCPGGGDNLATDRQTAAKVISDLTDYFKNPGNQQ
jgi:hypothetical protein